LGTAFGLAISTIAFDAVAHETGNDAPLDAYKAAQWTGFGMAMFCACLWSCVQIGFLIVDSSRAGALLAAIFLRGVGPVGSDEIQNHPEINNPDQEKTVPSS
jgi:hypothetical protein